MPVGRGKGAGRGGGSGRGSPGEARVPPAVKQWWTDVTPSRMPAAHQLAVYRASAHARAAARREELDHRKERAWTVARRAAHLLRTAYGATRVVVFGSLSIGTCCDERSDIDLAA